MHVQGCLLIKPLTLNTSLLRPSSFVVVASKLQDRLQTVTAPVFFLCFRMNHFKYSVGAPLHATEAFPTQQSQIQRFLNEVRGKWFLGPRVRKRRLQLRRSCNVMKMRTFVVFCSLINCVRMKSYPTFPVIIVATLARFSFPSVSMQRRETNTEGTGGKQYVYSWND